jgi:hypothetical protein
MKVTIPEELKKDIPQNGWGKILSATPIVMTVIATLLAGLATSEMTHAQYDRALGAQLQSKAGDQWGYFQAKKLRGAMQRNTLDLLQATTDVQPLDPAMLPVATTEPVLAALQKGALPFDLVGFQLPSRDQAAVDAVAASKPQGEVDDLLAKLTDRNLIDDLNTVKIQTFELDKATRPVDQSIGEIEKSARGDKSLTRDLTFARLRYTSARYDAEAALNQNIGYLLELQVRKANLSAERHHNRSQKFFFGMLAAQAGVIVSTFAMAARKRNLLWTLAATAGIVAVAFAIYVYLRV